MLRAARVSATKGKSRSVLSSRVLSGMIANTRASGDTSESAWSRIARSLPAERSESRDSLPMTAGGGLLPVTVLRAGVAQPLRRSHD